LKLPAHGKLVGRAFAGIAAGRAGFRLIRSVEGPAQAIA
jgi:hypothetical protein